MHIYELLKELEGLVVVAFDQIDGTLVAWNHKVNFYIWSVDSYGEAEEIDCRTRHVEGLDDAQAYGKSLLIEVTDRELERLRRTINTTRGDDNGRG